MGGTINETVKLILSLSISGGLFALALFAFKPFMRNRLSKSFQYYIWIVVLLRFMLPFSFGINLMDFTFNTPNVTQTVEETTIPNSNTINSTNISPAITDNAINNIKPDITEQQPSMPMTADSAEPYNILKMLADNALWIWLAGAVMSVAFNVFGYFRFIRYIHSAAYVVEMPDCKTKVFKSCFAPTPMLVGVFRPRIYLPDIEYLDEQLKNILLHELTHLRRRDIWLKWFVSLVLSVHWFNPVVYFMRREISRACELSCDEAVIRNLDSAAKQSYGDTLILVVAESRYPIGIMSTTMCEEKKKLKERLVAIMNYKKKTKIVVLITVVLAVTLTCSTLAFGANANGGILLEKALISVINDYKWDKRPMILINDSYYMTTDKGVSVAVDNISVLGTIVSSVDGSKIPIENGQSNFGCEGSEYLYYENGIIVNIHGKWIFFEKLITADESFNISLADMRQLSAKGYELTFEDFNSYEGQEVGSGLYILHFTIEGGYTLLVGGGSPTGKPFYAYLSIPGVDGRIDVRYTDIDDFISKYPVPNDLRAQIYEYLDTIMSSLSLSSNSTDYIKEHQGEYNAIFDMGVTALPTLTGILNNGDKGLRSVIAAALIQDIIAEENKSNKPQSEWRDGVLQSAASDALRWSYNASSNYSFTISKKIADIPLGTIDTVSISTKDCRLLITENTENAFEVGYFGNADEKDYSAVYSIIKNKLTVDVTSTTEYKQDIQNPKGIIIKVPSIVYNKLEISVDSVDFAMDLEHISGNIFVKLKDAKADFFSESAIDCSFNIKSNDSYILFTSKSYTAGTLSIENKDGKADLSINELLADVNITNEFGKVELILQTIPQNIDFNVNNSGKIVLPVGWSSSHKLGIGKPVVQIVNEDKFTLTIDGIPPND